MKKLTLLAFLLTIGTIQSLMAQSGDLEVVMIDPEKLQIPVGDTTNLLVGINQNGPGNLPTGSARVTISINTAYINWITPFSITDDCGNVWSVQTANVTGTTAAVQLRNNNGPLVNGASCIISLPVKGVAIGTAALTVGSTVFGPGVSDPLGTNQSATSVIEVTPPLPVTLVSFNAVREAGVAGLKWATTMETNSAYFEIQRSANGKKWNKIGSVPSHQESSVLRSYTFADKEPLNGENLYRLKMVDLDETFAYSNIRSLIFEGRDLSVYPNPVSEKLHIPDFAGVTQIKINDLSGRSVYQSAHVASGEISVKNLSNGIYVVNITRSNGVQSSQKIIISK